MWRTEDCVGEDDLDRSGLGLLLGCVLAGLVLLDRCCVGLVVERMLSDFLCMITLRVISKSLNDIF